MTESTQAPGAGWRDDPDDPTLVRYWDGQAWTEHRSVKVPAASAAPQATAPQGAPAGPKTGAPWWLAAVIGVVALLAGVGIGVAVASMGGDDDEKAAVSTSATSEPTDEPDPTDGPTEEPTEDPTDEPKDSDRGTATDPLSITSPWTFDASYYGEEGTQWEGTFEGLVPLAISEYNEDPNGTCYGLVGTMTPTQIAEDAFVTDGFDTPYFEYVVGGSVTDEYGSCETAVLEDAGYGHLYDAEVSVGTAYKFYYPIYLPSTVSGELELIVMGFASEPESWFFEPTIIDSVG